MGTFSEFFIQINKNRIERAIFIHNSSSKRMPTSTTTTMTTALDLSPLVAEHSREMCRGLGSHGGYITRQEKDGPTAYMDGVQYRRSEGISLPRVVHVQTMTTARDDHVFVLDEVAGQYTSGALRLWPLRAMPHPLAMFYRRLPMALIDCIAAFVVDTLPSPVPEYAHIDTLRTHVLCASSSPHWWTNRWMGKGRRTQTSWDVRKRRRRV